MTDQTAAASVLQRAIYALGRQLGRHGGETKTAGSFLIPVDEAEALLDEIERLCREVADQQAIMADLKEERPEVYTIWYAHCAGEWVRCDDVLYPSLAEARNEAERRVLQQRADAGANNASDPPEDGEMGYTVGPVVIQRHQPGQAGSVVVLRVY